MKRKLNLTGEQERHRRDGLRLLARVIARHYLEHPQCYVKVADAIAEGGGAKESRK